MNDNILVSISCITYNHENYIVDCLEGFLKQKTTFRFEILVHDDASTDQTGSIIREYANRYPELIKPIIQTENQHSKGIPISYPNNFCRAKGKYIALCEGDDYWIDENKLQKQIDYMEMNPCCSFSFHNAIVVSHTGRTLRKSFLPSTDSYLKYWKKGSQVYSTDEIILLDFVPTASIVFKKSLFVDPPAFYFNGVCGDLPMRLILSLKGKAFYFDNVMSAYRTGVPGSASTRAARSNQSIKSTIDMHITILRDFDAYTDYIFHDSIQKAIKLKEFTSLYQRKEIAELKTNRYRNLYDELNCNSKLRMHLYHTFPRLFGLTKILKKKIRRIF